MGPDIGTRKLSPRLLYPFFTVSILLIVVNVIGLTHRHWGTLLSSALLILGIAEMGLAIALFVWSKRR